MLVFFRVRNLALSIFELIQLYLRYGFIFITFESSVSRYIIFMNLCFSFECIRNIIFMNFYFSFGCDRCSLVVDVKRTTLILAVI